MDTMKDGSLRSFPRQDANEYLYLYPIFSPSDEKVGYI